MGRTGILFLMLSSNDRFLLLCCMIYLGVFINYYDLGAGLGAMGYFQKPRGGLCLYKVN